MPPLYFQPKQKQIEWKKNFLLIKLRKKKLQLLKVLIKIIQWFEYIKTIHIFSFISVNLLESNFTFSVNTLDA